MSDDGEASECYEGMLTDLDSVIASFGKEDASVANAARFSEAMIHLHDGKDYIDDTLPQLDAILEAPHVAMNIKCHVALGAVRMLAHGWQWEPESYRKVLAVVRAALTDDALDHPTKAVALLALDQIFTADNDSDTEQEEKTDEAVLKLLAGALLPKPTPGEPKLNIVGFLHNKLEPLLKSSCAPLLESASSLLGRLPQRKRARDDKSTAQPQQQVPKGLAALVQRLHEILAAESPDISQVGAVLKGISKVTIEAAFEAIEDLADEEIEVFNKVKGLVVSTQAGIERLFRVPGKGGVTYDDPVNQDKEQCPHVHFDVGVAVYAAVLAIRSSDMWKRYCDAEEKAEWSAPITEQNVKDLLLAWRGHRYHKLGGDFEMIEQAVAFVAKQNPTLWKPIAEKVPMSMTWTCCADPFGPAPLPGQKLGLGGYGF